MEWPSLTLKRAGVVLIDCVHATPSPVISGYPYIAIPQMTGGRIDFEDARQISDADFVNWTKKARPKKFDVVLSRRTNPGVVAPVQDRTDFALGQNLVLLRADGSRVAPEFLRWLTTSPQWWSQIEKFMNVGAIFNSLKCADVPNLELPIPPLFEQRSIAALLSALDDKIEVNRRMNETLEASVRALFRDWFVDFGPTRAKMAGQPAYLGPDLWSLFPDRLDADGVPDGWGSSSIYEFAEVVYGAPFASDRFNQYKIGRPMARIRDLSSHEAGQFTDEVHKKEYVIQPGSIVVGMDGEFRAHLWHGVPTLMNQRVCTFIPKAPNLRGYVWQSIEPLLAFQEGSAIGTTVIHLGKKDIDRFMVLAPTSLILDAFGALIEPLIDAKVRAGAESRTLAETRDMLLPKLMSGAIRARQIADAPATISG